MSNMVIQLLSKVTSHCKDPFVSEELGEKFATALNYCLDQLTSEKGLKIKVKNPERFYFEPKSLLVNIVTMYGNMMELEAFQTNVVNDDRSYSDETFGKAVKILNSTKKKIMIDEEPKQRFVKLVALLRSQKQTANDNGVSTLFQISLTTFYILSAAYIRRCPRRFPGPTDL